MAVDRLSGSLTQAQGAERSWNKGKVSDSRVKQCGLSGRALAAQARGVLGSTPVTAGLFTFLYFSLITSKFLYFQHEAWSPGMTLVIGSSSYLVLPVALPCINIFKEKKNKKKMLWPILCSLFRWSTDCKWHYLSCVLELCYCPHCFTLLSLTFRLFQLVSTVSHFFQLFELVSDCHSVYQQPHERKRI